MAGIEEVVQSIKDITDRYGLKILDLDHTDITLISRIGFSREIFIQIYTNKCNNRNSP